MSETLSQTVEATWETPSQPSQKGKLGSLGSLFEHLARREKELISDTGKVNNSHIRNRAGESLPNLPSRFLSDPPPPYYDRVIIGHGLPVEYWQSDDGEHYLKNETYYFRPLNPAHSENQQHLRSSK